MKRSDFLKAGTMGLGALVTNRLWATGTTNLDLIEAPVDDGVFSAMFSFRVSKPLHREVELKIQALVENEISQYSGFLGSSLKQMIGDSTMVKNMPAAYKGLLANAAAEGAANGTMPYVYLLLVRFDSLEHLQHYSENNLIKAYLQEINYLYSPKGKTDLFLEFADEPMVTVAAGNRNQIFERPSELSTFLDYEHGLKNTVTVANHVSIKAEHTEVFEQKVTELLKIAQNTYQPENSEKGLPGGQDNLHYRKALTTEILRGAKTNGAYRNYIMHGVWESYWDHENSHLDPRFKAASAPVGAYVVKGPVEPFYTTLFEL